jgi:uncharacterized RDD family membrane protein YckC
VSRTITVVTPENITVTYQAAGFASRFLAFVIDAFLQLLLILAISTLARYAGMILGSLASASATISTFVVLLFYPSIFESLWNGRTPGKRVLGLRVMRDGGYPINFTAAMVRNILKYVADLGIFPLPGAMILLFGLPGLVTSFFSKEYRRIGDYAAGTVVVMDEGVSPFGTPHASEPSPAVQFYLPYVRNLDRLTLEEYRVLRRFVARRKDLEIAVQAALGEKIARSLLPKLEIAAPVQVQVQFADILEAVERRYAEEYGVL